MLAHAAGGSLGRALDGVAGSLREDLAVASEVSALAGQARASALLIGALPLVFGVIAGLTDTRTLGFLFRSRVGWACLVAAVVLNEVSPAHAADMDNAADLADHCAYPIFRCAHGAALPRVFE